jgi:23S rRNA pseudouridine2605 synthase
VLSKLGICSRTQAGEAVRAGRVALNGRVVRDPEYPTDSMRDRIVVDGRDVRASERIYLMLNKPRGYVTTASDERGRNTVYDLLGDASLPWIAPVGRLDKSSEGLLLFTNDSEWAARITSPATKIDKIYHVQIDKTPNPALLEAFVRGIDGGDALLSAKSARELRRGEKNAWLEIVLDEGRNRQIRRLLAAHGVGVLRLVRVAIGPLALGTLEKGRYRPLDALEVATFAR